ncbi:MAG: hypothetical protein K6F49_13395 [Saccharofermentans sp.]|nr:hypothetical protein [Saccharofermentans sp.]
MSSHKKITILNIILSVVSVFCLIFFIWASRYDKVHTSAFNDVPGISVSDATLEDCSISYSACTVTLVYHYDIQNNSNDDKNIYLVGLFPENRGEMCINREVLISNDSYFIAAGDTASIEVTYTCRSRYNNTVLVDYVPETHIVEAK